MKSSVKILSLLLALFTFVQVFPFGIFAEDDVLEKKKVSVYSSECGYDLLEVYTDADGRWYMDIHDIMRYTRSTIRAYGDDYLIAQGILERTLDVRNKELIGSGERYDIRVSELDGKIVVHAAPLLQYLGAECSWIGDALAIAMPTYTPWEVLTLVGTEDFIKASELFGSEAEITFRLYSNAILKIFDSGVSSLFTMDYTAILSALQVDLSKYESAFEKKAEDDLKMIDGYFALASAGVIGQAVDDIWGGAEILRKLGYLTDELEFLEAAETYRHIPEMTGEVLLSTVKSILDATKTAEESFALLEIVEKHLSRESQFYDNVAYAKDKLKDSASIVQQTLKSQAVYGCAKKVVSDFVSGKNPITKAAYQKLGLACMTSVLSTAQASLKITTVVFKALAGENSQFNYAEAENNVILLLRLRLDIEKAMGNLWRQFVQANYKNATLLDEYMKLKSFYYRVLIALNEQVEAMIVAQWGKENRPEMKQLIAALQAQSEAYAVKLYTLRASEITPIQDYDDGKNAWDGVVGESLGGTSGGTEGNDPSDTPSDTPTDTPEDTADPKDDTVLVDCLTYTIENGEVTITGISDKKQTKVKIPETIEGYPVTAIGTGAFAQSKLVSVSLPKTMKKIGEQAFGYCTSLERVFLNEGLEVVGGYAFAMAVNLNYIVLPSTLREFGEYSFTSTEIEELSIPEGVTEIPESGLYGMSRLVSLTLPKSLERIGEYAFSGCAKLFTITVPEGVSDVKLTAFTNMPKLIEILNLSKVSFTVTDVKDVGSRKDVLMSVVTDLSQSILEYADNGLVYYDDGEEYVLLDYLGEESRVVFPATVKGRSYHFFNFALQYNETIRHIVLEEGITAIPDKAFYDVPNLESVQIPNGVRSIGECAFMYCDSLSTVNIPSSVESIGDGAFVHCLGLNYLRIPGTVKTIGENAFQSCYNLYQVELDAGIESIHRTAFKDCYKLIEVIDHTDLGVSLGNNIVGGGAGYYAKAILSNKSESRIVTENDFVFYVDTDTVYLLGYVGKEKTITLPESYDGKGYALYGWSFYELPTVREVMIPKSVIRFEENSLNHVLTDWFYLGSSEDFAGVTNLMEDEVTVNFYSQEMPADWGDYWYFDENGNIALWKTYFGY